MTSDPRSGQKASCLAFQTTNARSESEGTDSWEIR